MAIIENHTPFRYSVSHKPTKFSKLVPPRDEVTRAPGLLDVDNVIARAWEKRIPHLIDAGEIKINYGKSDAEQPELDRITGEAFNKLNHHSAKRLIRETNDIDILEEWFTAGHSAPTVMADLEAKLSAELGE